ATFHVGRDAPGGNAVALIEIDGDLPEAVLAKVRALPQVQQAKLLPFLKTGVRSSRCCVRRVLCEPRTLACLPQRLPLSEGGPGRWHPASRVRALTQGRGLVANVGVVGSQWGDEGKGKIVDWLSEQADIVVRFQGGHNAGHTLVID